MMCSEAVLVYITGYPGSGKTTLAQELLKVLPERSGKSVRLFSDKERRRPTDWLFAGCWLVAHAGTIGKIAALIEQTKHNHNLSSVARSFVKAVRLMLSQFALLASIRSRPGQIIISDEPPLHRLWTFVFPARRISMPLLEAIVKKLVSKDALPCRTIYLPVLPPRDVCVSRFTGRSQSTSRFDMDTPATLISDLMRDEIYPSIQAAVRGLSNHSFVNVENRFGDDLMAAIIQGARS